MVMSVRSSTSDVARSANEFRRRCPVHDLFIEDDPALIPFPEDSDDPRVYLPAHRIGDTPPEGSLLTAKPRRCTHAKLSPATRRTKPHKLSQSSPALFIGSQATPMRTEHGSN